MNLRAIISKTLMVQDQLVAERETIISFNLFCSVGLRGDIGEKNQRQNSAMTLYRRSNFWQTLEKSVVERQIWIDFNCRRADGAIWGNPLKFLGLVGLGTPNAVNRTLFSVFIIVFT